MRRILRGGMLLLALAPAVAACGPDWQPSWNVSSTPVLPSDSLTVQRIAGRSPEFQVVRSEDVEQLRLSAGALLNSRPLTPEEAMRQVPEYRPVPRPDLERQMAPPSEPPPPRRQGSSMPPPDRREGGIVNLPGQPPSVVTGGTGRVQSLVQPGNPAGGVAIQDGGSTTVIQPGGRVTTVPTPR